MSKSDSSNRERQSFGISMPPELAERVEAPLQFGDTRSERIRHLIRIGIKSEEGFGELNGSLDDEQKERIAKQAVIDWRQDQ